MITKPTLFILGAGASIPYGFPSGAKLRTQICAEATKPDSKLASFLELFFKIPKTDFIEFVSSFQRSRLASIDSFLSRRTEFSEIGKLIIASLLVPKETAATFNESIDDDWYFAFWNALVSNVSTLEDLKKNNVQIYTFNYDRSLEAYLHIAIVSTFKCSADEALNAISHFNIHHVYGSLGVYGPPQEHQSNIRPYFNKYDPVDIRIAADTLRVIPEARADDAIFRKAKEAFLWAEHVCFLGFGFDPLNVERLGFKGVITSSLASSLPSKIIASTLDKTFSEVDLIHEAVVGVQNFHDEQGTLRVHWDNYNSENLATLRRFAWLLQ